MPETKHINEEKLVAKQYGKWADPGVPHKGWTCVRIEDLGSPEKTCEMCESQEIRYVHYMQHDDYEDQLAVGCICAGNMEQDLSAAKARDKHMQSRAGKRARWLSRKWRLSKAGNEWVKADDYHVVVYPRADYWVATVSLIRGDYSRTSEIRYKTSDEAKLAAFDLITHRLSR